MEPPSHRHPPLSHHTYRAIFPKIVEQMLAECGLCLAVDDLESKKGGVLTTAAAMGMPLVDRLNKAGMTFRVLDE